ncbi:MAG: hypothetical protein J0L64_17420 [Acidobacteria bacterium]|nr:hypothetical protein [Acidobacteriota bacterium]
MTNLHETTLTLALTGGWMARAVGLLCILFVLAFVIAEGPPPLQRMTGREVMFALGMLAMFGGLAVAWRWEAWGGAVAVVAWIALAGQLGEHALDPPFLVPVVAGALHLLCAWRLRGGEVVGEAGRWGVVSRVGWVLVAVFVVLCANEMFGQPPLMAGSRIAQEAVGEWEGQAGLARLRLRIAPDGGVVGALGVIPIDGARMQVNRSWFGRLIHWRSDYVMRSSEVSLHVDLRGGALEGTLTRGGHGRQISLRRR